MILLRACKMACATAALALTSASVLPPGCRGSCRSLEHCDPEICAVLTAVQLGHEQPQPVGCVEQARNDAPGVSTYARDGAGACWIFPTTLIAEGFAADESCSP